MRHFFQRWAIVFLVVTRLIFGEFAYAMPHDSAAAAADQTQAQSHGTAQSNDSGCPDHVGAPGTRSSTDPSVIEHHHGAVHDPNCCKTSCYCPCLHLSAIVTLVAIANLGPLHQQQPSATTFGHTPERVFLLLRPPA